MSDDALKKNYVGHQPVHLCKTENLHFCSVDSLGLIKVWWRKERLGPDCLGMQADLSGQCPLFNYDIYLHV